MLGGITGSEQRLGIIVEVDIFIAERLMRAAGRQHFMGLRLFAGKEALIQRRETELLGRGALEILQRLAAEWDEVTGVDVCTGSGNLALAYHMPKARVFGADFSGEAVVLAQRNARNLGLAGTGRVPGGRPAGAV